jgi:SAM-dependent methyltransferase
MKADFWDQKYGVSHYHYGEEPNRFLQLMLESRPPGRLLLPAEGEGRNAVYAAKLGWEVHAFDQSGVARNKALQLAKKNGVEIHYDLADIATYKPSLKFDAIALVFVHLPESLRQSFHQKLIQSLSQVGEIWLEAFTPAQLQFSSGGPQNEAMLYTPELLQADFASMQIRQAEVLRYELQEGPGHQGLGEVVRLRAVNKHDL